MADQSKTNVTGRRDETGAIRHREPELCAVGAIGNLLWAYFHLLKTSIPDFAPDHTSSDAGPFGKRPWYNWLLFPVLKGAGNETAEMDYQSKFTSDITLVTHFAIAHYNKLKEMHIELEINLTKVTHAGCNYTVKTMREYNADQDDTKKLGLWGESGAYRVVYDRGLPLKGLLAAAMFDADRPENYSLPRAVLRKLLFLSCYLAFYA